MTTVHKFNESSRRYTYGYPGAEYPNLESAVSMAKHKYKAVKDEYGDEIKETFDQALVMEENSVYVKMTRVVKQ